MPENSGEEIVKVGFHPNLLCRLLFNLEDKEYIGKGVSPVLESVLGAGYRFLCASDPFCGGKTNSYVPAVFDQQHVDLGTLRLIER